MTERAKIPTCDLASLHPQRDSKEKSRSYAQLTFNPDPATVHFNEFFSDVEPEPGAAELAGNGGIHLLEFLENVFELVLRDTDTSIRDPIEQGFPLLLDGQRHPAMRNSIPNSMP